MLVIQGEQNFCNHKISEEKAGNQHQIAELSVAYIAGYRHKGDPGKRSANHPISDHKPWRTFVANKESSTGGLSGGNIRHCKQKNRVGQKTDEYKCRCQSAVNIKVGPEGRLIILMKRGKMFEFP